jgi:phosphoribosylformylglycinamidine synthase
MTPYEVMLSESQERMLVIVKAGAEDRVASVFRRWGLDAVVIGRVTAGQRLVVREGGRVCADLPVKSLTDQAPVYERPATRPAYLEATAALPPAALAAATARGTDPAANLALLRRILASPNVASKSWIYRQYDHTVQTNTVLPPGSDAAVLRIRGSRKGLAFATDGNGRYVYLAPRAGGSIAVAEAARNVACSGARPCAITNCLNFGNPEDPEISWQFRETIAGMAEACQALGTPVTGGNVSFYNETMGQAIYPTPVVGMLGLLERAEDRLSSSFAAPGDLIVALGPMAGPGSAESGLAGSEYLKTVHGAVAGVPAIELGQAVFLVETLVAAAGERLLRSAHDCSDGGLATCLTECCLAPEAGDNLAPARPAAEGAHLGADVAVDDAPGDAAALFGEWQSRALVSIRPAALPDLTRLALARGAPCTVLGRVTAEAVLRIRATSTGRVLLEAAVDDLGQVLRGALACLMS